METLKQLPIGVQNFESLRNDNYLYVDKTALVYRLATTGRYYFLSRPRRFGKSLLISTLHAYFDGKKELFDGLAIADLEKDWIKYPVLHLDLNVGEYSTSEALREKLLLNLTEWETLYGRNEHEIALGDRFAGVIRRAAEKTGQRTVILVDEYDKPILQAIDNDTLQNEYRTILKGFYGALKTMDAYIKFAFLTGVTKFGKVSVFSDLNNLKDISMYGDYMSVCGITDEELDTILAPYTERLANELNRPVKDVREELRFRYDGYHFEENSIAMYNPFSVLNTFDRNKFGNYWFETGTPSYLVYLLKKHNYKLKDFDDIQVGESALNSVDSSSTDPIPVIYQSGYLTIKDYDSEYELYKLGFPNKEVETGFLNFLLPYYTSVNKSQSEFYIAKFIEEVRRGDVEAFMERLQSMFAGIAYDLNLGSENNYQNVLVLIFKLMGLKVHAEYKIAKGRIDTIIETSDYLYVFEYKLDGTAEQALAQINDKGYLLPFKFNGKKLIKVGVNFSSETRNIERWIVED